MRRIEEPWIEAAVTVSPGLDSPRINLDHPVDDPLPSTRGKEGDYIAAAYLFLAIGDHQKLVPGLECRVHGGPHVVYACVRSMDSSFRLRNLVLRCPHHEVAS
jgi:hypothetical protein